MEFNTNEFEKLVYIEEKLNYTNKCFHLCTKGKAGLEAVTYLKEQLEDFKDENLKKELIFFYRLNFLSFFK
ncbi:MAG: hypothetical protein ACRC0V_00625 [Fusobacteriaceae bacterium]